MSRTLFEDEVFQARDRTTAAKAGGLGGLLAGLAAANFECLFLLHHVGAFVLRPGLVGRALALDALAGIVIGAGIGLLARWRRLVACDSRESAAVGFALAAAASGGAFLVSYLRGMAFPSHHLSLRAPAAVAVAAALALLAFVVLSFLLLRLLRNRWTRRESGSRGPLAAAAAVALLIAAPLLVALRGGREAARNEPSPLRGRPNVLLVVLDTARPDYFSSYGDPRGLTPNLDRLAAQGQVFLHAYSSSNWSIPGHASLFSGLYPSSHGAIEVEGRLDAGVPVLAEILSRSGWLSASFYENALLGPPAGLARGFSAALGPGLDHRTGLTADWWLERLLHRESRTPQCLGLARDWMESAAARGRPSFVFLNLMPTHFPYVARQPYFDDIVRQAGIPPASCRALAGLRDWNMDQQSVWKRLEGLKPGDLACLRALYASNIAHLDATLGSFLDGLQASGRLTDTILVVTSDHGENLGEHGLFTHMRSALFEPSTRVPLIVWAPGRLPPGRITSPASLVDVMPTILALAGQQALPGAQGLDLRRSPADRMVLSEYWDEKRRACSRAGVVSGQKIIVDSDGSRALYDLASDPGESTNLASREPERTARLHASLLRLVAGLQPPPAARSDPRELEDLRQRLRSLGYIQ